VTHSTQARDFKIFAGNSNPALARDIAQRLGVELSKADVGRFSDGEIAVEIGENVRGSNAFIIQSTSAPVNDHLMELLIMTDALRRASAGSITAVVPYFGYARQDRKVAPRAPITAKLVANMISAAGITRVLSMDLHAGQLQGFFDIPTDNLFAMPVMLEHIRQLGGPDDLVIVSPDAGGVERARAYSKRIGCTLAIVDKRRQKANVSEVMNLIGEVRGKTAVLLDDMVDTAGTLAQAAAAIAEKGATRVVAFATHAVLSGPAVSRIEASALERLYVTDTIQLQPAARACGKIQQLSVAETFSEAIRRVRHGESLSSLFV
jgi:ribose-phosphate pyrophosphokinase